MRSMLRLHKQLIVHCELVRPCIEAGSNTFTVTLLVIGGNEKGTQCAGI
jgi:hypothetical protein